MEAAFKKHSSQFTGQQEDRSKQQQRQAGGEKENPGKEDKAWYEQLAGAIPEDKEEQKKWYKLLTNPLTIIAGILIFGYWWFSRKEKKYVLIEKENEELKAEIARLKKKYKKHKKQIRTNAGHGGNYRPTTVLD